jgi:hypothetical protein
MNLNEKKVNEGVKAQAGNSPRCGITTEYHTDNLTSGEHASSNKHRAGPLACWVSVVGFE